MKTEKGFTLIEVVLAVSLGIILLVASASVFSNMRFRSNVNRSQMLLSGLRSNISMYKYRRGGYPPLVPSGGCTGAACTCTTAGSCNAVASICTNTDDQGAPFFPGTTAGVFPAEPVSNLGNSLFLNGISVVSSGSANCPSGLATWSSSGFNGAPNYDRQTMPVGTPVDGGWLYDATQGVIGINLKNDPKYGVNEEQPQPNASPQVGGW